MDCFFYIKGWLYIGTEYTPNIKRIGFYGNKIEVIGENLLSGLNQLESVNFGNNPCVNVDATTREQIQDLNKNLHLWCSVTCSADCMDHIDVVQDNVVKVDGNLKVIEGVQSDERDRLNQVQENVVKIDETVRNIEDVQSQEKDRLDQVQENIQEMEIENTRERDRLDGRIDEYAIEIGAINSNIETMEEQIDYLTTIVNSLTVKLPTIIGTKVRV
ncbi:CLUMA_CG010165, isoform A [Clunio marinus]|uniref:CLUMA_CG010165, isoform A n=1 Tax=Clunio marinus TaxID=568069 RepID=A0A1J1I8V7_9DIPT|nr:CLUMA_CG010165, isoform A [Clunio marinus]